MFRMCLESPEYTSRRNALTVLKRLISVYPVADVHVQSIRKSLDKVGGPLAAAVFMRPDFVDIAMLLVLVQAQGAEWLPG